MKTSIFLAISFLIILLENSILNYVEILGSSVDFLLIYICLISISLEKKTAIIVAIASGLLRDMLVGNIIGLNALLMFTMAYLYNYIKDKIFKESRFTIIMLLIFASVVGSALKMTFYKEYINGNLYITVFENFIVFPFINSTFAVVSYKFFERFNEKLKKATSLY